MKRSVGFYAALLCSSLLALACSANTESTPQGENPDDDFNDVDLSLTDFEEAKVKRVKYDWKDSGKVIDGHGKEFNNGVPTMVSIESKLVDGEWKYPENITFQNWTLKGAIRVIGMGPSSDTTLVKESSRKRGHTERMRKTAPRNIVFKNLKIVTNYKIPIVFGPGVHNTTIENSVISGASRSVAIYVDAESGDNIIRNNVFDIVASRELIALDGSARNLVEGNIFESMRKGAVHVYRNSGERGVVRHQEPRFNVVRGNYFNLVDMKSGRAVFLGSRNGTNPNYRHDDAKFNFGSGASNRDFARENTVELNRVSASEKNFDKFFVKDTEGKQGKNVVKKNVRVKPITGLAKLLRAFSKTLEMPSLAKFIQDHTNER